MGITLDIDDVAAASETAKQELAEMRAEIARLNRDNLELRLALERSESYDEFFKIACWLHADPLIGRYLMSNAHGRWNGGEKAQRHIELCQFYVAAIRGHVDPERIQIGTNPDYKRVHASTQKLTDRLDEKIGFPLTGEPDYEILGPLFFDQFHRLAMSALLS